MLALATSARSILEIGTLGGYSTIWLARALPADGRLTALELEPHHAAVARENLSRAGLGDRVDVRVGDASLLLRELRDGGAQPFDMVFIDADKPGYPHYLAGALQLSRPGTLIVADNVVSHAELSAYAAARQQDPTLVSVTVPVGSGLEVTTVLR